jgi:hypothetical protein
LLARPLRNVNPFAAPPHGTKVFANAVAGKLSGTPPNIIVPAKSRPTRTSRGRADGARQKDQQYDEYAIHYSAHFGDSAVTIIR